MRESTCGPGRGGGARRVAVLASAAWCIVSRLYVDLKIPSLRPVCGCVGPARLIDAQLIEHACACCCVMGPSCNRWPQAMSCVPPCTIINSNRCWSVVPCLHW